MAHQVGDVFRMSGYEVIETDDLVPFREKTVTKM
jgi:hypothetical protein